MSNHSTCVLTWKTVKKFSVLCFNLSLKLSSKFPQFQKILKFQSLLIDFSFSDEHSGKVKSFMLDILCPLITESDSVSNELLDIILQNIVEPLKSQRKNAYKLARELLLKCSDTLEPYIQAVSTVFF